MYAYIFCLSFIGNIKMISKDYPDRYNKYDVSKPPEF